MYLFILVQELLLAVVLRRKWLLTLVKKTIHRVRRGESLGVIAEKYGVGLSKVLRANRLSKRSKIYVGQKIIIPGKAFY